MSDREQQGGPQGWKRTTLGEALPIYYGKARNDRHGTVRVNTPVYGSSGRIDTFNRALTSGPSLIIGRKGNVGAAYYSPEPCWPIDTVYFAEASEEEDLRFFKYLLDHLQLVRMDRSTAVPGLSRDDYNATEVLVPELDQQRLVVAEIEKQFSRLDEAVANLKRVKANLKRYKAAVLKAAVEGKLTEDWRKQHPNVESAYKLLERILAERRAKWTGRGNYKQPVAPDVTEIPSLPEGWAWATFEQISLRVTVGHVGPMKHEYISRGVPFLRSQNIRENKFDPEGLFYIPREFHAKLSKSVIHPGDLAVVRSGSVGVTCVIPETLAEANCADLVLIQQPHGLVPQFGAYYMNSLAKRRVEAGKVGVALTHFNTKSVAAMPVPVPPLIEQQLIVAEVERRLSVIDELESTVEANLTRADRLRQAILKKAFEGKLLAQE